MKTLSLALVCAFSLWLPVAVLAAGTPPAKKMTQGEANAACKAAVQGRSGGGMGAYMACVRRKMAGQE
jgi:hypothetical protein